MDDLEFEWTGERYVTSVRGNIALEHLHRYALARDLTRGKVVLDIACGEGYGSYLLAEGAKQVIGVDIDGETIEHATRKYHKPNLCFRVGSCSSIPVDDGTVDAVVSFETIEHHDQHHEMMREIKRVLKTNGILVLSSPDKHEYSEVPKYRNQYHVKELYHHELVDLIKKYFSNHSIYGQRVEFGSFVAPVDNRPSAVMTYHGNSKRLLVDRGIFKPIYFVAIASDGELPEIPSGMLIGITDKDLELEDRAARLAALGEAVAQHHSRVDALESALAGRDRIIAGLQSDLAESLSRAESLNARIAERDATIALILRSKSWRITAPLRRLRAALQRLSIPRSFCRRGRSIGC